MNNLNDSSREEELIDLYYSSAVEGIEHKWFINLDTRWYNYISSLPIKEKVTYHIVILDEEVINGGFHQYFINRYGQFAKDTITSLNLINAKKTSLILKKAYDLVNNENIEDIDFREKILKNQIDNLYDDMNLYKELNKLDEKYYDYQENISDLLLLFLASENSDSAFIPRPLRNNTK